LHSEAKARPGQAESAPPPARARRQLAEKRDRCKDSLWAQALGPLEDPNEHGGNRLAFAKLMRQHYRSDYEALFSAMPNLDGLPQHAGPNGTAAERAAWNKLSEAQRRDVSRVFANIGKAIAAYEATLHHGPAPFDNYIGATLRGAPAARLRRRPCCRRRKSAACGCSSARPNASPAMAGHC
jgi:cytochrome c peroxidase